MIKDVCVLMCVLLGLQVWTAYYLAEDIVAQHRHMTQVGEAVTAGTKNTWSDKTAAGTKSFSVPHLISP